MEMSSRGGSVAMPPIPTFVLSTGRCGSTLLSEIFRAHPRVLSLSEFFTVLGSDGAFSDSPIGGPAFWKLLSMPNPDTAPLLRLNLRLQTPEILYRPRSLDDPALKDGVAPLLMGPLPHITGTPDHLFVEIRDFALSRGEDSRRNHYDALFDWLRVRLGKEIWVERSGSSLGYASQILAYWPNCKVIHLYRDGRDCAVSMSRNPMFRRTLARLMAEKQGAWPYGNRSIFEPEIYDSLQIPIERFGLMWTLQVLRGVRLLRRMPADQILDVQYERFVADPVAQVSRIVAFVLPGRVDPTWIAEVAEKVQPTASHWRVLPAEQRRALERACRPGLDVLGYLSKRQPPCSD